VEEYVHTRHRFGGRLTIGLIPENSANEDENRMRLGVLEAARRHKVNLIIFTHLEAVAKDSVYYGDEAEQYQRSYGVLQQLVEEFELDGLLFLGWSVLYDGTLETFKSRFSPIPLMSLGRVLPGLPCAYFNGGEYIEELLLHLIHHHRYQRIAYIDTWNEDDRKDYYLHTMQQHHLYDPNLFVSSADLRGVPMSERAEQALSLLLDKRQTAFDAMVVLRPEEARLMLKLLTERGIRVPEDVALTCYEDHVAIEYVEPPMTTVYVPFEQIGYAGCERMIELLHNGQIPQVTPVSGRVIYRQSCGCKQTGGTLEVTTDRLLRERAGGQEQVRLVNDLLARRNMDQILLEFSQSLLASLTLDGILDLVQHNLELLGIQSCSILLGNRSDRRFSSCTPLFEYAGGQRVTSGGGMPMPTLEYAKQLFARQEEGGVRIVSLLHAEENNVGFISFEPGPEDGLLYLRLAIQISNALGGAFTVNKLTQEIALRKEQELQLSYYAHYDPLTGLLNRRSFYEALRLTESRLFYVFYLDADGFKSVNDTLGHDAGDQVIAEIAERIKAVLKDKVLRLPIFHSSKEEREDGGAGAIFRMGGDEFVAIVQADTKRVMEQLAKRLVDEVGQPYGAGLAQVPISCSLGISSSLADGVDRGLLVQYADLAMYRSKKSGGNTYTFFTGTMEQDYQDARIRQQ
jgi:GGDEF domain-containing protein/DNA-binding LacI/PurR family transcriptional regulator